MKLARMILALFMFSLAISQPAAAECSGWDFLCTEGCNNAYTDCMHSCGNWSQACHDSCSPGYEACMEPCCLYP